MTKMQSDDVIVVGAGASGMAAADEVRRAGRSVTVIDAAPSIGGRVRRVALGGDSTEAGAQGIHTNYDQTLAMIERQGLTSQLEPSTEKVLYLDRKGRPRTHASNLDMARNAGLRGAFDLTRFMTKYFARAKPFAQFETSHDIPEYDNVTAAQAFAGYGEGFQSYFMRPMVHAMGNCTPDQTSLYYVVNSFRLALTTKVFTLRGGNATLLESLGAQTKMLLGTPVAHLLTTGGRVDGVLLEDGRSLKAKHVIVATTAGQAGRLLPDEFATAKTFLQEFPHSPFALVFFFLDRTLPGDTTRWMGHPHRDTVFNMAVDQSRKTPHSVPSGRSIISAWSTFPDTIELMKGDDAHIVDRALADMEAFIPRIRQWTVHAEVVRHDWGVARYLPGGVRRIMDFKRHAETLSGVSFAGTDYEFVHMEGGVLSGQRAARRALRQEAPEDRR